MTISDENTKVDHNISISNDVCKLAVSVDDKKTTAAVFHSGGAKCANCGKEGDEVKNACNKCEMVKYCNAKCKKEHKKKHKKNCEEYQRRATELAAELHDKKLFKQPPPAEDCPICFLRMPFLLTGRTYMQCCGKLICNGCAHAPVYDNQGNKVVEKACAFCRAPHITTVEELQERYKKRVGVDDPVAIRNIGWYYRDGAYGYPQDYTKALELWHRAGELGYAEAYCNIGYAYDHGRGVEVDRKKARHYYELAAMRGDSMARHNLGIDQWKAGNMDNALKHNMIAVRGGNNASLEMIKDMYSNGHATKEDYTKALRSYQEYLGEIKSKQRDEAAAASEDYRYH